MTLKHVRNYVLVVGVITIVLVISNLFTNAASTNNAAVILELTTLQEVVFAVDQMEEAQGEERIAIGQFQLSGDAELLTRIDDARATYDKHWAVIVEYRSDEKADLVTSIAEARGTYKSMLDEVVSAYVSNPTNNDSSAKLATAITYYLQTLDPIFQSFAEPEIESFAERVEVERLNAETLTRNSQITAVIGLGVSLAGVGMAFAYVLGTQRIVNSITEIIDAANAISRGDLDVPIDVDRPGEIGELAKAIERMRTSLKAAIERLRR